MTIKIAARGGWAGLDLALDRLRGAAALLGMEVREAQAGDERPPDIVVAASAEEAAALGLSADGRLRPEGFEIRRVRSSGRQMLAVLATDRTGAMYGVFELAERLLAAGGLEGVAECLANPALPLRAVKFNLPWSTYRTGAAFELQRETVRDLSFWRGFLGMMAENRYNALTLWCLHPFPYMIRPTNFPKACPFTDAELAEWKAFWTALFRMAREHGIETYMVNWNIFVSEAFRQHYDPNAVDDTQHYYGDAYSTELIERYTRECVTQLIDEYPDLTGIGTSLGERMNDMTPEERQRWIENVYYEGMRAAGRPVKFIHRAPFSVDPAVTRTSIEKSGLPEPIWLEVKFNWSHAYSSTELLLTHGGSAGMEGYWSPPPETYKITWMMRNEDFFTLRWAQPTFVRAHLAANVHEYTGGYYIGSECFIPADDYSHRPGHPHIDWRYAYEKHWLYYMLWGRLLYDPAAPDSVFADALGRRFGAANGQALLKAYEAVCGMPMALASFFAFTWDFTLYAEGFIASDNDKCHRPAEAFISLRDLLESRPFDPRYLSLREYAERLADGRGTEGRVSPIDLAERLERDARRGLEQLDAIGDGPPSLACEKADIEAWALLGLYFAAKLRAGASYAVFERTGREDARREALYWLAPPNASAHWERLCAVTGAHYQEQPLLHLGNTPFTWELFRPQVEADLEFVRHGEATTHAQGNGR